jgi:hypothetical protein
LDLNILDPIENIEDGVPAFRGSLRNRIKLHVLYKAGELRPLDTKTQLEAFEELKWERMELRERQRGEARELVIPGDIEDFDLLLRTQYGQSVRTEATVDEIK